MILQSWRICGVSATIVIYIGGILFLSMNRSPSVDPKKNHVKRFTEFSNFRSARFSVHSKKMTIRWCKDLKYLKTYSNIDNMATQNFQVTGLTALVSFPGSGNTWLRYLLQQATGILTGSVYKDYGLLKTGFPAENVRNNSVLLVKTHEFGSKAWEPFTKAILLVRDPQKAILAEFNRQSGGHVGFASPDRYKRTKGKYWQQFVTKSLKVWEATNLSWARDFTGSVKVVFYEDLVSNMENVLRGILNFLEFPIDEALLSCTLVRKEGIFRRKKRILNFEPFTPEMQALLQKRKRIVYEILEKHN